MKKDILGKFHNVSPQLIGRESYHESAVFIPLIETDEGYDVLLEVRSSKLKDQPGDICLPGGAIEAGESPRDAALREACEELLVSPDQVDIVCAPAYYLNGSLIVHVYAGYLHGYGDTFSTDEVAEVFRVPLNFFIETKPEMYEQEFAAVMNPDFPYERIQGGKDYRWRKRIDRYLFYNFEGREIWGFTAAIMHSFTQML